ncbi:MAG: hypothetical protein COY58_01385 [Gammaproteobacteria bacterium CG_4_10_14_0_8_um_filter_38_16]|nr:MAG: hypothetical protein COY58_01385 [Gammaproteobacteria bacterium CG_4_10_14_0_8_um_filter_38_16]PJA03509.1 MAG: hypothetical protein COX72_04630 [Gammaproteobacteria bacterium CG_4_10_14_0_2_um_filter_38_22]PJB10768.1 MAG: hypothetical protein CO120_03155 [Gammaproteobacteria bacterium CG_4_9_14_3_um_filter_38_9]
MYINYCIYQNRSLNKIKENTVKERAQQYFLDLYTQYQMPCHMDFTDLVSNYEKLWMRCFASKKIKNCLKEASYILFPSWGVVLDSDFAVPELYFKEKFEWSASILDIRDCGRLCVFYAVHLLLAMQSSEDLFRGICCTVEDRLPIAHKKNSAVYPEIDYAGFLSLSNQVNNDTRFKIQFCDIFNHRNKLDISAVFEFCVEAVIESFNLSAHSYVIYINNVRIEKKHYPVFTIFYPTSSGFLYYAVNSILNNLSLEHAEYIVFMDIDILMALTGVLLIQKVG